MATTLQISSSLCCCCYSSSSSIRDVHASLNTSRTLSSSAHSPRQYLGTTFATGSPLCLIQRSGIRRSPVCHSKSVSIRCEQSTEGNNGIDVWLGRVAMIGFAAAITVEITTGKGLLENFGLTSPLPTVALAGTALVGVLTAVFIFQSAPDK